MLLPLICFKSLNSDRHKDFDEYDSQWWLGTHYYMIQTMAVKLIGGAYICIEEGSVALVLVTTLKCADEQVGDGKVSIAPAQHPHHTIP